MKAGATSGRVGPSASRNEIVSRRIFHEIERGVDLELVHYRRAMEFESLFRNRYGFGDFLIASGLSQHLDDSEFEFRQHASLIDIIFRSVGGNSAEIASPLRWPIAADGFDEAV